MQRDENEFKKPLCDFLRIRAMSELQALFSDLMGDDELNLLVSCL